MVNILINNNLKIIYYFQYIKDFFTNNPCKDNNLKYKIKINKKNTNI